MCCEKFFYLSYNIRLKIYLFVGTILMCLYLISISSITQGCIMCLDGPVLYKSLNATGEYKYIIEFNKYTDRKIYNGIAVFKNNEYTCESSGKYRNFYSEDAIDSIKSQFPPNTKKKFYVNSWSKKCFNSITEDTTIYRAYLIIGIFLLLFTVLLTLLFILCLYYLPKPNLYVNVSPIMIV